MQFYNLSESQHYPTDNLIKPSAISSLFFSILCVALLSGGPSLIYFNGKGMPLFIFIIFQLVSLVVFMITFSNFLKSLKPDSWLLNILPTGILIKYRSYRNRKLPTEDKQIIFLDFTEIESANKTIINRYTLTRRKKGYSSSARRIICLDLNLRSCQNPQIDKALFAELGKRIQGKSGTSISYHYPVSLIDNKILRIDFSGYRPSIAKVLDLLLSNIKINDPVKITEDYTQSIEDDRQLNDHIMALTIRGERFAAKSLVRKHKNLGISEANDYIANIIEQQGSTGKDNIDELEIAN